MTVNLSDQEKERYHRQIILPGWGEAAQQKLKQSVVFIAGAGGLGSPVSLYLAAAGIGVLRICDDEKPELSNLNRQILHSDQDLGKNKADSARESIARINPHVQVEVLKRRIEEQSIKSLVGNAEIIIDCLDNFPTRFVLNEFAVNTGLPMIHAGVYGLSGQITFIHSPETPCLACTVSEAPPQEVFPILGATAGVMGCLQALETLKYLTGAGALLKGRFLFWDGEAMRFHEVQLQKDPDCRVCGRLKSKFL